MKIDWRETTGYVLIILASCFFGGSASLGKNLMNHGVSTIMLMETRSVITTLFLLPGLLLFGRNHLKVERKDLGLLVLLGIPGIALVNASYYFAVKTLTVALAVFLQFTAPILVFLYGWMFGKEKVTQATVLALVLSLGETYFMVRLHSNTGSISMIGVASAILSTISYAFYVILSHEIGKKYSPWTLIFYGYGIAALFWCVVQNPVETVTVLSKNHLWKGAMLFSLISTLIPFTLFLNGLRRVTPTGATIASTSETVSASFFAYIVLDESLTRGQIAGAVLIVSAIFILAYRKREQPAEVSLTA